MKPFNRWALVVLAVVLIAILLLFWSRRDQSQAPTDGTAAIQPDTPMPPKAEEPVAASVLFDFDRAVLRPGETQKLDELTAKLQGRAFDGISVVGHADQIGTAQYNLRLSEQRADAVRAYLAGKGVDEGRIRTEARGETEAVTGDACRKPGRENWKGRKLVECLQPDRRVEVTMAAVR